MEPSGYVSPGDIITKHNITNKDKLLKIMHLNARSLLNKTDEVTVLIESCNLNFEVLMFTETWYNDDSEYYALQGYEHFNVNRKEGRGGGVAILTSLNGYDILREYSVATEDYEVLCIKKEKNSICGLISTP